MTNLLLGAIFLALLYIADTLGDIRKTVVEPKTKKNETVPTVTRGVYAPVVVSSNEATVGISEAKTPQLIEFEAEQELLKKNQSLGR